MNSIKDLALIIQSKVPLVVIESDEEERVLALIRRLAKAVSIPVYTWAVTGGLVHLNEENFVEVSGSDTCGSDQVLKEIRSYKSPSIFVLCDFHPYLENSPQNVRMIKEIALGYKYLGHTLIFLSHRLHLPDELKAYSARFEMPMPDAKMLKRIVYEEAVRWSKVHKQDVKSNSKTIEKLIKSLMGLTISDARRLARKAIYDDGIISESDFPRVNKAKYELLNLEGLISFEYETSHFSDVGGFKNLKDWLRNRESAFRQDENDSILDVPRGIMLLGVQGCGKSLAAKAAAGAWSVPLLRLDFAILYNKFFGETESNLRKALKMAELMAPCVLWIDEIEKGIASGDYDSGTSRRVLGSMLTWMAERKKLVFIVATSNDITSMPPELIRKGRLDEIFFVDLPDGRIREEIFKIHLNKRKLALDIFDLKKLGKSTEGFSGAEIEQAIVSGLYRSQSLNQPLSTELILEEINSTSPLSVVMAEEISQLRLWASGRTVQAN